MVRAKDARRSRLRRWQRRLRSREGGKMRRVERGAQCAVRVAAWALLLVMPGVIRGQDTTLRAQRSTLRAVAIRNATVLTIAGPAQRGATVLIRNGKIAGVGANLTIPSDATVVDASGKYVMPGLIDAMTYFGIDAQD